MFYRIFTALCAAWMISSAAWGAVPRGQVLGELMQVLDLPFTTGRTFGDVNEDTPYGEAIDSALSLGILYPADDFSPEIDCSNAEALMFAFQAMGFRHEAEIMRWARPPVDTRLPDYIAGYVAMASAVKPEAPSELVKSPWSGVSEDGLVQLINWADRCRRYVEIDCSISSPEGTLRIHREHVGRPPRGWRVQLGMFDDEDAALALAHKKSTEACPLVVNPVDFSFAVVSHPYTARSAAWAVAQRLKGKGVKPIVLPDSGDSGALFWASFTPARPGDTVLRMSKDLTGNTLSRLSKMAEASGAFAAINGGYFGSSGAIGTLFSEGLPVNLPYHNRSMAAWNDDEMYFGGGEYRTRLSVNGGAPFTVLLNLTADYGETAVLTPALGRSERRAGNNGTIARVYDGLIQEAVPALKFHSDMGPGEWIIVTRDPELELQAGDRADLVTQWREDVPIEVQTAVQAGPLLYAPGKTRVSEGLSPALIRMRHPRTLMGWTGSEMVWIVVDGRSSWHSRGLTLDEATAFGRRLGLKALLNLDGGGSSELWWNGHVVNRVSDGHERAMPYGLMVLKHEE